MSSESEISNKQTAVQALHGDTILDRVSEKLDPIRSLTLATVQQGLNELVGKAPTRSIVKKLRGLLAKHGLALRLDNGHENPLVFISHDASNFAIETKQIGGKNPQKFTAFPRFIAVDATEVQTAKLEGNRPQNRDPAHNLRAGRIRAATMSPEEKKENAIRGVTARWGPASAEHLRKKATDAITG